MKQLILSILTLFLTTAVIAQNNRLLQGFVQTDDGEPLAGATIRSDADTEEYKSGQNGSFELRISPYSRYLIVSCEGYLTSKVEIDTGFLIVRLKVDKKYAENKAIQQERIRQAQLKEAEAQEQARLAARKEADEKAKAEEQARLAAEKAAADKAKAEEQARLAAEKAAAEKAKAEEQARLAAEKAAADKARAEEQARIAAEKAAAQKAEQERIAAEKAAAEKAKAEELARLAAKKQAERAERDSLAKVAAKERSAAIKKQSKGYGSAVDVSYIKGNSVQFNNIGMTYTAGYRFNNLVYLGVGTGVKYNFDGVAARRIAGKEYTDTFLNPALVSIPAFAYFKANFINSRLSPYFALATGATLSKPQTLELDLYKFTYSTHSLFANPQIGLNLRTTTETSVSFAVGLQCFTAPSCTNFTGYNATIQSAFAYGLDFHLGFTF